MAKLFEYGWLNGVFKISDWTEENAIALRELLSSGGWQKALQLESRARSLLQQTHVDSAMRFVNKTGGISNEFFFALGSNVNAKELAGNARLIEITLALKLKNGNVNNSSQGMGQSLLRQTMGWINLLADVPGPSGLRFTPFENAFKQSRKYGRVGGRTSNLAPEEVGQLLKEANKWIYSHSKPILELFKEMSTIAGQAPDLQAEQNQLRHVLAHSEKKQEILKLLNVKDVVLRRPAYAHSEELS
ncbi:MAG: hypothetical protein EON54_11695, partial [Alcaligenaceae bacterium]